MPRPLRSLLLFGVIGVLALLVVGGSGSVVVIQPSKATGHGSSPDALAARTLRLPSSSRCVRAGRLGLRVVPPGGSAISRVRVTVDGDEVVLLEGIFGRARAVITLPSGSSAVRVTGRTINGSPVSAERTYRRCSSRDRPPKDEKEPTIIFEGGGED